MSMFNFLFTHLIEEIMDMLNYSIVLVEGLHMADLSEKKFDESQLVRMDHILYAKEAGDRFLLLKQELAGATPTKPKELEGIEGSFTSFQNFLEYVEEISEHSASTIKEYVKLAENWDIVLKLNMQDKENVDNYGNCMRINRTLKIIRWYEKVEGLYPPEKLTIAQYWLDEEARLEAARQAKAERDQNEKVLTSKYSQLKLDYHNLEIEYNVKVSQLECRISELEAQIAKLSSNRQLAIVG